MLIDHNKCSDLWMEISSPGLGKETSILSGLTRRTVSAKRFKNSYLYKLHFFIEYEEPVVPAVTEQEIASVVTEEVSGLVDLAEVVASVAANLLLSGLQINLNQMVGGLVSQVDFVVIFNQEPEVGFLTLTHRNFMANLPISPFAPLER